MNLSRKLSAWLAAIVILLITGAVYLIGLLDSDFMVALQKQRGAAVINHEEINKHELAEALRSLLWKRGEAWNELDDTTQTARRNEALETLINEHLIRERALSSHASSNGAGPAFQQFLKQFEGETWRDRIIAQGLTEGVWRKRISTETQQRNALEGLLVMAPRKTSDAEARAWFAVHQAAMIIPERIHASHLFLCGNDKEKPDRTAEIQSIYQQLSGSTGSLPVSGTGVPPVVSNDSGGTPELPTGWKPVPLSTLITKYSEDDNNRQRSGDLGWFSRDRVPADFAAQAFALPIGKVSEPFQTKLGWHIVLVQEKRPARLPTYEEAKEEIIAKLDDEKRQAALKTFMEDLRRSAKITLNDRVIRGVVPPTE